MSFYFCHILSPWIRRGLVAGGFGIAQTERQRAQNPVEIAPIVGPLTAAENTDGFLFRDLRGNQKNDVEVGRAADVQPTASAGSSQTDFEGSLVSTLTPYFLFDISSAVRAAERETGPPSIVSEEVSDGRSLNKADIDDDGKY